MIRYVLALALAVTVLGMGTAALDHAASVRGEQAVESEVVTLEAVATDLQKTQDPDPTGPGPKRVVELDLPADRMTVDAVDTLVVEPAAAGESSVVTYRVGDRREASETLAVPIRHSEGGALDLSGRTGTQRLVLRLVSDPEHGQVVEITLS